jgi:hypothetical protein
MDSADTLIEEGLRIDDVDCQIDVVGQLGPLFLEAPE